MAFIVIPAFAKNFSAFEKALIALAKPQTVDTDALSKSLQAAVIRLAAARAGADHQHAADEGAPARAQPALQLLLETRHLL